MGMVPNINFENFPRQGSFVGMKMRICFNYDSSRTVIGECVREDTEEPGRMILKFEHPVSKETLYVLSTECMYQPVRD